MKLYERLNIFIQSGILIFIYDYPVGNSNLFTFTCRRKLFPKYFFFYKIQITQIKTYLYTDSLRTALALRRFPFRISTRTSANPKCRGSDSRWCHWNFSFTKSFRPHYGPGVELASNRNEYQEYFLGVKAAGA